MVTTAPPTPQEVEAWICQAPDAPGCLMGNDARAFELIRATILRRLLPKPGMWWQQTLNALGGCVRHLALLAVGVPTLHLWASLIPDSAGEGPASPIPPGWTEPLASDAAPSIWSCIVLIWVLFVVTDVALLGGRVGGFRYAFGERAASVAWYVW